MSASMKDLFRQHHRLDDAEQSALWNTCTFALDANVLLNIYRYADATREDLFRVLEGLGSRIWVPHQAAKEFYKNRVDVITEQQRKYAQLETALDNTISSLRATFQKSAFLGIDDIEVLLKPAIEKAKAKIQEQKKKHPDLVREDCYLERLASIIGPNLGSESAKEALEEACKEAQSRIDKELPPGYRDAKKTAPGRYGDVLIWFELLEQAEAKQTAILLITDDDKEDWWQILDGKKLGPRPELREEMRRRANVEFLIVNPAYFLQKVSQQLNDPVSESSVDDATQVTAENREQPYRELFNDFIERNDPRPGARVKRSDPHFQLLARQAEEAVRIWISLREPESILIRDYGGPYDFLLRSPAGREMGIEVKLCRNEFDARHLNDLCSRAFDQIQEGAIDDFRVYLVAATENVAFRIADRLRSRPMELRCDLSIGFLNRNGEYKELDGCYSLPSPDWLGKG